MTHRFLIDEQLPPALADTLTERGFPSEHVTRVGLAGRPDVQIWRYAIRSNAAIISKDEDFAARTRLTRNGPAVVWIRLGNATSTALWRALEPLLPEIVAALANGERLIEIT